MDHKANNNASDKYLKPRDRFYEFLEQHETLGKKRKTAERKGAICMVIFLSILVGLALITHENAQYDLVNKIFGP